MTLTILRTAKSLTQKQLADMAGVSQDTIHRYERGGARLSARTLPKIARALGMDPRELGEIIAGVAK